MSAAPTASIDNTPDTCTKSVVSIQEAQIQPEPSTDHPVKSEHHDEDENGQDAAERNRDRPVTIPTVDIESLVVELLKKMVRKAIIDESAAKGAANNRDRGALSEQSPRAHISSDRVQDPPHPPPVCLSPAELVQQIVTILNQSTIVRAEQDVRSRFWKLYKTEAEEFHVDFIGKYGGELDISLIFSNLAADPNSTIQVLLMMVVRSLNNTAFPGQDLVLPQFTGPDRTTVWVQSLLYASLGAGLFAALAAMLGKEWLSYYSRIPTLSWLLLVWPLKWIGLK
ncbi:hypothetical protein EUX98_g6138 [Antrodiella citrinella]|uniref:DUF6535 domain-containing protein n=1 Tax=Antrodiella citrinella TaxID=2447956 RepID=A0A4S4MRN3_9APHY|nr:hypothetical protein EUX98_g6138 [Antrodiella citrinella]